jgi:hypothetical protein
MNPTVWTRLSVPSGGWLRWGQTLQVQSPRPVCAPALQARLCWQLPAGCAQTLRISRGGRLEVLQGRLWLTAGAASRVLAQQGAADDVVLMAGQSLALLRACVVVVEAWSIRGEALQLAWCND